MRTDPVEAIANAVLYEGYMLYPYRPSSLKNRQRFNFGVAYPEAYCRNRENSEMSWLQAECLLLRDEATVLEVKLRFLQIVQREIIQREPSQAALTGDTNHPRLVERLEVDGKIYQPWQEVIERDVCFSAWQGRDAFAEPVRKAFSFAESALTEEVRDQRGQIAGQIVRSSQLIEGEIAISAQALDGRATKVIACVSNQSQLAPELQKDRNAALCYSMVSTHLILKAPGGEFVSLIDPPESLKDLAGSCRNTRMWPVLAGEVGQRDTVLASPIILYDFPQIAPESAGDLFDGTEIDEILALRILTMTEEEKKEAKSADDRTRRLLERTEMMPQEHFMRLHGTLRSFNPSERETP